MANDLQDLILERVENIEVKTKVIHGDIPDVFRGATLPGNRNRAAGFLTGRELASAANFESTEENRVYE